MNFYFFDWIMNLNHTFWLLRIIEKLGNKEIVTIKKKSEYSL
jgi:hypothetical protein